MKKFLKKYAKGILAAIGAGISAYVAGADVLGIIAAVLATGGVVVRVPNRG